MSPLFQPLLLFPLLWVNNFFISSQVSSGWISSLKIKSPNTHAEFLLRNFTNVCVQVSSHKWKYEWVMKIKTVHLLKIFDKILVNQEKVALRICCAKKSSITSVITKYFSFYKSKLLIFSQRPTYPKSKNKNNLDDNCVLCDWIWLALFA